LTVYELLLWSGQLIPILINNGKVGIMSFGRHYNKKRRKIAMEAVWPDIITNLPEIDAPKDSVKGHLIQG
jgi:hypothetical protein